MIVQELRTKAEHDSAESERLLREARDLEDAARECRERVRSLRISSVEAAAAADIVEERGLHVSVNPQGGVIVNLGTAGNRIRPDAHAEALAQAHETMAQAAVRVGFDGNAGTPLPGPHMAPTLDPLELLTDAWGVIANASGGDWTRETDEWIGAARRFHDNMASVLSAARKA